MRLPSYGSITINKKLTLKVQTTTTRGTYDVSTEFDYITFVNSASLTANPSGSVINSVIADYITYGSGTDSVNDVTIDRCLVYQTITLRGNNWLIKNCLIGSGIALTNFGDNEILNNFFNVRGSVTCISGSSVPNTIQNNVFYGNGFNSRIFNSLSFADIANNIFFTQVAVLGTTTNCAFANNIVLGSDYSLPPANNSGAGNLNEVDPMFTEPLTGTSLTLWSQHSSLDLTLLPGSPAIGAATDGGDIGIYGGRYPLPNTTGDPALPKVTSFDILNSVISPGGTLNVEFSAESVK